MGRVVKIVWPAKNIGIEGKTNVLLYIDNSCTGSRKHERWEKRKDAGFFGCIPPHLSFCTACTACSALRALPVLRRVHRVHHVARIRYNLKWLIERKTLTKAPMDHFFKNKKKAFWVGLIIFSCFWPKSPGLAKKKMAKTKKTCTFCQKKCAWTVILFSGKKQHYSILHITTMFSNQRGICKQTFCL